MKDFLRIRLSPITKKRWKIFKKNRLASGSLFVLTALLLLSLGAEFIANDKPYVMRFHEKLYFPIFQEPRAAELGITDSFTIDYQNIQWSEQGWALFPPVRFNPFQSNPRVEAYPSPPSFENPMGTDDRGRDVFARLLYGFRISFIYALGVWLITYLFGVSFGLTMGFFGERSTS